MTNPTDPRVEAAARVLFMRDHSDLGAWLMMTDEHKIRYHEDARAALKAADKTEWQPIESAPRDGTRILICKETGHVCAAFWEDGEWYGDDWYCIHPEEYNTHWMPLPTPPETP